MRKATFAFGCTCVTAMLACMPAGDRDDSPRGRRAQAVAAADALSGAEWSAYVADQQYVHRLVAPGVRARLNYADPRQHAFALARLKLAGKTPENSPHLFERVEARRQRQLARGLKAGAIEATETSTGRAEMHYIEASSLGTVELASEARSAAAAEAVGTASSTFPGGSAYTYIDMSVATVYGYPIAPLAYVEEFENPEGNVGANVTVSTSGNLNASNIKRYAFESYKLEDYESGDFTDSYIRVEAGNRNPTNAAALPRLSAPTVDQPIDHLPAGGDGQINICMDRAWVTDCDYILHGGPQSVEVPLKGSIRVLTGHVFDEDKIEQIRDALADGQIPPEAGSMKLVLTNVGGGCDVLNNDTLVASMMGFWASVRLSPMQDEFSWDITGDDAARFDEGCRQVQDVAKLTARIPLPLRSSTNASELFSVPITVSSDPDALRPEARLNTLSLTNSCLAEGTQIQLGGGALAPVESLRIGQSVFNPYARGGHTLTITDTAAGTELAPMVRIRDEAGRALLLTEMHPIATPDRGMVQARALREGDVVMTRQGPSRLAAVSREPYGGKVYNLKVGSEAEAASLGQDETVVYANGFVVGDGQIQSKYEALAAKPGDGPAIERVAEPWRRDYLLSPRRK
jgi:hypothetical protein